MPSPCNNLNVIPIKVSQLVRYKNIDVDDFLLTIESGSGLYSRKSTFGDLVDALGNVTGSYTGSFSGSFKGKSSGSFSGSYWGSVISKNTKATGSFNGKTSGSFSGSILSKNTKATGSFYGNKSNISGSFSGSFYGSLLSKNTKASGSFSGSHYGSLLSKNTKASGSFSGSHYGSLLSKSTKASGSFSGSHYGKVIGSTGSLITGSFRGIDNITNFKGTGKKVSFNGTSSYSVSSSFATVASTSSYVTDGGLIFSTVLTGYGGQGGQAPTGYGTPWSSTDTDYLIGTFTVPTGKTLKWFRVEGSVSLYESQAFYLYGLKINSTQITSDVLSSWGWGHFSQTGDESSNDFGNRSHFTIEGKPTAGTNTGTLNFYVNGTAGQATISGRPNSIYAYVVGYY